MSTILRCRFDCGTPLDPALEDMGLDAHPGCEYGVVNSPTAVLDAMRASNREHNRLHRRAAAGSTLAHWIERDRPKTRPDVQRRPQDHPQVLTSDDDGTTQLRAAARALPGAGTKRRDVYDVIVAAGPRGLAHFEIEAKLKRSYSQNGPRVRELVADGHVVRAPRTRETPTGSHQDVWVATINVPPTHREEAINE